MKSILPNPWLLGLGITLFCYILIYGLKRLLTTRLSNYINFSKTNWDDIVINTVGHTSQLFMLGSSLYIAFQYIPHPKKLELYINRSYFILMMIQIGIWVNFLLDQWISTTVHRRSRNARAAANSIGLLKLLAKFLLFSVIFLFTLNNLDIKITTILTGLGVGGLAVALAIQKVLGDVLSSLSIMFDKPFVVGDFIIIDQYLGEVEKIGVRTTHIRGLGGEQIIISNSDILSSRIRNMKRMQERRVSFILSLTFQKDASFIKKAIALIASIVTNQEKVRFDRCHFISIGRTSLDFEVVYFVLTDDYNLHMDINQQILLEIYQAFTVEGLNFAYPIQTLHHLPSEVLFKGEPIGSSKDQQTSRSLS